MRLNKRQKKGTGSFRVRKNGIVEYRITAPRDYGHAIQKSFYGKNERECRKKYSDWLKEDEKKESIKKGMLFKDWSVQWLELYKKDMISFGTYSNYEGYLKNRINPFFGKMKIDSILPAQIQKFYKTINTLSKTARMDIHCVLKGVFAAAIENRLCQSNPVTMKPSTPKDKEEKENKIEVFTLDEVEAILESEAQYHILPKLLLYTGMRVGEACALKWSNVDLENNVIYIEYAVSKQRSNDQTTTEGKPKAVWKEKRPKSGRTRVVYLSDKAANLINTIPKTGIFVLNNELKGHTQLTPRMFETRYRKFFASTNLKYRSPHKCRHTYATYLIIGGAELVAVQALLGHSTVRMTEQYLHAKDNKSHLHENVVKLAY